MWQDTNNVYGASSSQGQYYTQPNQGTSQGVPLQFYAPSPVGSSFYPGSRSSLEGNVGAQGPISQQGVPPGYGGNIQSAGGWWTAFGTGGFEGEPPLLEELGINFSHIRAKSLAVLNPLRRVDERIMDDADLAGPLLFIICFGTFLLFSGKPQFGYIYGVGLLGSASIYVLLNLMSEIPIDAFRVVSVLGYCLLPMVGVGAVSVMVTLDGTLGYLLSTLSILWCTYAASAIFVAVLRMSDQRFLVAYPVGLLYGCFALLSVFNVGGSGSTK
ncbi:Yip1-domain-containing protein [Sparassis latifolia]|uniref:Protein YIP n=1 Tax=Sparassis crispa TaxID=139825 RepID=A0A401GFP1_9APHY|nr:Protein transport protein [Sparassis crispa]GBE80990.1 Protein transport protein [Sparassis crispa]